jgi:hypothetical protein
MHSIMRKIIILPTRRMPELAEVECSRAFVSETFVGSIIEKVCTKEQGGGPRDGLFDELVFDCIEENQPGELDLVVPWHDGSLVSSST